MDLEEIRMQRYFRYVCGALILFCVSSLVLGIASGGIAGIVWRAGEGLYAATSDPVLHFIIRVIEIPLAGVLFAGHLAGLIAFLAFACVLFIPWLVVLMFVKLASLSVTGAIIVFIIVASVLASVVRKYWKDIAEGIAWLTLLLESVWRWFNPASPYDGSRRGAALSTLQERNISMSDRFKPSRPNPPDDDDALVSNAFTTPSSVPTTLLSAFRSRIQSDATTEAVKSKTKMVNSVIDLGRAHLSGHELQTDWNNRELKRDEKTIEQKISLYSAEDKLAEVLAKREEKAQLPRNPTDRLFEAEYKPTVTNAHKAKVHDARSRAEALIEASRIAFELEEQIDAGPGTPEQKADLKRKVRIQMEADQVREEKPRQKASASAYADEHED